jgi:mannosyl-3-phosphoglycerate phosphatase
VILLGREIREIRAAFDRLSRRLPVMALSRMSTEEVEALTGLSGTEAEAAKNREFGEAFVLDDPDLDEAELKREVRALGLRVTRGGRFWHLLGENDKGRAVRILSELYRKANPGVVTGAVGDAPNDIAMLAAVDRPFLVARPDGTYHDVDVAGLIRVPLPGPAGFNRAALCFLGETGSERGGILAPDGVSNAEGKEGHGTSNAEY